MFPLDYLDGSFEFETEIGRAGDKFYAEAMGIRVEHADQEQALNDLNQKLNEAMEKGELRPDHG